MEKVPHILLGVARGKFHPHKYPHLEFKPPKIDSAPNQDNAIRIHAYLLSKKKGSFIAWCLMNTGDTYCHDIYMWFMQDPTLDWVETYDDLIQAMKGYRRSPFEPRHFDKVNTVYKAFTSRDPSFIFEDEDEA